MSRLLKYSFVLTCILLVFFQSQNSFAGMNDSKHLVSPELLKFANLQLVWENAIPLNNNETLEQMLILGDQIYLISDRNFTMALNRQNGKNIFYRDLALDGLKAEKFIDVNDQIIYVVGNKFIELEKQSGIQKKTTEVSFGITAPVVRNNSFFYVGGTDDRLHIFDANNRLETFKVAGNDDSLVTTAVADEDFIIFGTKKGNIYSMLPDAPKSLWEFEAAGGLVGQIIRDANSIFFACEDMNVYRIDVPSIYSKSFVWKTLVPGMIQKNPRVTDDMVYQSAFSKNMSISAIDRDSGRIIWEVSGGLELLAQSRGKAYVITEDGMLVVMHNASSKQVYSVNFANVSRQAYNTIDSKIYIGDKSGRVACLEPLN
ncbi:MAG: PQQ-binding-like beta-propeller repeat protein [Sedimentisphaerales bacterium]|nr:PQQ-binding-like beta-propeller repeat protein [Sedimentisphaerales bacterium]